MQKPRQCKSPGRPAGALNVSGLVTAYLPAVPSCVEMLVNVDLSDEPSVFTTVMMATEMPAAISPYSIAVAPDSSFANRVTRLVVVCSCIPKIPVYAGPVPALLIAPVIRTCGQPTVQPLPQG